MIQIISIIIFYALGWLLNKVFTMNNKENIFSYNIGVNEIILSFFLTFLIGIILYDYYNKSSLNYFFKIFKKILFLELFLFSFLIGTLRWKFFDFSDINKPLLFYTVLMIVLFFYLERFEAYELKIAEKENKEPDLYKSRNKYLSTIDSYLERMESFSVIGKWGIGKTKLIENFFEKECEIEEGKGKFYKDKYEYIYIDSSIYSENQKIIETLEKELLKKFKKYKVLKLKNNFIKKIFLQNETILKVLYNFLDFEISPKDETTNLANEIAKKNKILVICLDNLERLGSRERISNLFAIIDELISKNIKKIYIYDEEYMKKIFKKDEEDFLDYIKKYTFNTLSINGIKTEETLKNEIIIIELIENLKINYQITQDYIINFLNAKKINKKDIEGIEEVNNEKIDRIIEKVKIYMDIEKIMNPRYFENLKTFIKSLEKKIINEIAYLFEYKIIKDNFQFLTLEQVLDKPIDLRTLKVEEMKELDSDIQKICVDYLFKLKNANEEKTDLAKKINYFKIFYTNESIEESDLYQELNKFKENPEKNLFKILEIITVLHTNDKIKEIRNYLESIQNIEYIINTSEELGNIFFSHSYPYLWDLEEYFDLLFPILRVNTLGYYNEGKVEYNLEEYLIYIQKLYFFYNENIRYLLNRHLDFEKYKEYLSKASVIGVGNHLEQFFGKELDEYIKEIKIDSLAKDFENLDIDLKAIRNSLYIFKNITRIEQVSIECEEFKEKIGAIMFIDNIRDNIEINKDEVIITNNYIEKKIVINKTNVENHIEHLIKLKKERKDLEKDINFLLIELSKIKK